MAEQKTEDTKPPVARRGARPFVGPAGVAPAARPLLRPAATPARGRPPFAPPLSSDRLALGAARAPALPVTAPIAGPESIIQPESIIEAEPIVAAQPVAQVEPIAPVIPVAAFEPAGSRLTPVAVAPYAPVDEPTHAPLVETPTALGDLESMPAAASDHLDFGFPMPSLDEQPAVPEVVAEPETQLASPLPLSPRPITSEMIALDAFAAFDSVWGPGNTPAASPVVESHPALDAESLGSADTADTWADEITAGPAHHTTESVEPTTDADTAESPWARATTPNSAFPSWLIDDDAGTSGPVPELSGNGPDGQVAESRVGALAAPQTDPRASNELRVSAALDRLAERIRGGEIDVSSVAPEAPDAAMLASVLVALLGGSHSR